jgi:hypothetical protein
MADLQTIILENQKERERLLEVMEHLREEDFQRRLPNGWTLSVTLVHLAFWDLRQAMVLKSWMSEGGKFGTLDARTINDPLGLISESIPPKAAVKLAAEAAEKADGLVGKLSQTQVEELMEMGQERTLRRCLHRRAHLDKIVQALE